MNENLANEIRKTIESIKDMKTETSGINNHLGILEGLVRFDNQKKVDEAYQCGYDKGYDKGYADKTNNDKVGKELAKDIYQRGLNDAWEAARKIVRMSEGDLLNIFTECYPAVCTALQVLLKYDASEAIEKLKAYEEKQKADDKIEVGDEVRRKSASENERGGIVTKDWEDSYFIMWTDGSSGKWDKDKVVKTGRHFDIASILEDMKA